MTDSVSAPGGGVSSAGDSAGSRSRAGLFGLALGSIGVVYGDIGTKSALRISRSHHRGFGSRSLRSASSWQRGDRAQHRAWRGFADPVGALCRRHLEIRRVPVAGRQQWRRRHAHADGAGVARGRPHWQDGGRGRAARHHQRGPVLWRCRHHSGAVGLIRSRRHRCRYACLPFLRRAADCCYPAGAVCRAVERHCQGCGAVRPDYRCLVRSYCDSGAGLDRGRSGRAVGAQSLLWRQFSGPSRHRQSVYARRGVPRCHRRRGFVRRSRTFRPLADPDRLAWPGAPCAGAQLSGAGCTGVRASGGDHQSVLLALSRLGARPDGGAGDRRDCDCEPGRHHRRLFAHQSGDPARPLAAARDTPHLGRTGRPDLHAARHRPASDRRAAAGRRYSAHRAHLLRLTASQFPARWLLPA